MKHGPHGHTVRKDFAKGDLVQWNRWYPGNTLSNRDGRLVYKQQLQSHLGIVLRVYQSGSNAHCWTADVKFMDAELNNNYYGLDGNSIPLGCLVKLS